MLNVFCIEEPVGLSFVQKQFTSDAQFLHLVAKRFGGGGGDEVVFRAEEHDGRRGLGREVVKGREGFPVRFDAVVSIAGWAIVKDGVKQHERIRFRRNC